jgi:predicted restriction endonuclease
VLRAIKQRWGRAKFRKAVLEAYERKCAISGCNVEQALDAAHIEPFQGGRSDRLKNAILLRTDLHTLFDFHLIAIDTKTWRVVVADELRRSTYGRYHGAKVRRPRVKAHWPDPAKVRKHRGQLM